MSLSTRARRLAPESSDMSDMTLREAEPAPGGPEERRYRRYPAPLEASLLVDGDRWSCWVRDISVAGAGLNPAIPAALGRRVELHSPHFEFGKPLVGRVINVAEERTCLAFELDEAAARELTIYLASTVDGK
jgi:PilZ domain